MNIPQIIQGGMGVAISNWTLANAVSRVGQLGVVSGTGISIVMIARLMDGDEGGHVRRALSHFPVPALAERALKEFYIAGGKTPGTPYKKMTMWSTKPPQWLNQVTVMANFMEVWLAKEGHEHMVGINLLEKVQMPNISSLYGAMLAGVDVVIMGAGIPFQIPGILDSLSQHQPVSYRLDVNGADPDDDIRIHLDPEADFPGIAAQVGTLKRPYFLPIISSNVLAQALLKRATGRIDGFVIETPLAGGHNAPPRGQVQLNEDGEPIYTEKDMVNLEKMVQLGLPFWLAGSYGHPEQFATALEAGAAGVQVGTAFAYCDDSGMEKNLRSTILGRVMEGDVVVRTSPLVSPTGFPFKVVQMPGTVSDLSVYEARERVCDLGFLRTIYKDENGKLGYRCPSEPVDHYVKKGGAEEDTVGRTCLCNHLGATAGFANTRSNGYVEPPIVTSGDDLVNIWQIVPEGQSSYTAADVVEYLLQGVRQPEPA
jgi:NAD(P)H-dependent flavin oxidoreductase YrpB (nitropropane dioxygenase family)